MTFTELIDDIAQDTAKCINESLDEVLQGDKKISEAKERAKKIKMVIFDVDGTLTDGVIGMGNLGELFKSFNCRDGMGFTLAHGVGIKTAIITGRTSELVQNRANELKISSVWQGVSDKRMAYAQLKEQYNVTDEEVAYLGDDLNDLPIMKLVALPCAVGDAVPEVKKAALFVAEHDGGKGAARDTFEFILKAQDKWQAAIARFTGDDEVKDVVQ